MNIYFIFYEKKLLLEVIDNQYVLPTQINDHVCVDNQYAIGNFFGNACYAVDAKSIEEGGQYELLPLKLAFQKISDQWFAAASRAYQIIQWDINHSFCGRCGKKIVQIDDKFEKRCDDCHLSFFPKISPAIIVRIQKQDQILLARQKNFPEGVYGLIAGFIEPGETAEEALHREVYEETGIKVTDVKYFGSQSWPFPDSLMLAFTAEYVSGELTCLDGELEFVQWFDRESIPGFPSSSSSIARTLINDFLK